MQADSEIQEIDPLDQSPPADPVVVALVELFRLFMGLGEDQVLIYNSDWMLPSDSRIYVTIALLAAKPFGSSNKKISVDPIPAPIGGVPTPGKLIEQITVQSQETYSINIFSASNFAMLRQWEISAAMNSTTGQQAQEQLGFSLATLPISVVDLSGLEGSKRLFRYVVTITLLRSRTRENVVEYYDTYSQPVLLIEP